MAEKEAKVERLPPQAIDAEIAVLGSVLLLGDSFGRIVELLDDSCFYRSAHQMIFEGARKLFERGEPIDIITMTQQLERQGQLDSAGGAAYLAELSHQVPSAANIEYHARIVLEKALLRKLIEVSAEIQTSAYEATEEVENIVDAAEQRIFALSQSRQDKGFRSIYPLLKETFEIIENLKGRKGGITGVPTGFTKLDEYTSGLQPSDLIIVAGRPSMGKTAFALNVARNAAVDSGLPVGIFSLEMASYQIAMRMLCAEAKVSASKVRNGVLPSEDWQKLSSSVGHLSEAPLYVDDSAALGVLEIRSKSRRLKAEHGLGMIIVDYLQLIHGPKGSENRQQEISSISRALKALAKELDVPVVALSQLSRAVESRGGDRRPMLSDLRESGAIEQDADVVMFVYRPGVYGPTEFEGEAEIIIGKQRNGPIGTVKLTFLKEFMLFANPAFVEEDVYF